MSSQKVQLGPELRRKSRDEIIAQTTRANKVKTSPKLPVSQYREKNLKNVEQNVKQHKVEDGAANLQQDFEKRTNKVGRLAAHALAERSAIGVRTPRTLSGLSASVVEDKVLQNLNRQSSRGKLSATPGPLSEDAPDVALLYSSKHQRLFPSTLKGNKPNTQMLIGKRIERNPGLIGRRFSDTPKDRRLRGKTRQHMARTDEGRITTRKAYQGISSVPDGSFPYLIVDSDENLSGDLIDGKNNFLILTHGPHTGTDRGLGAANSTAKRELGLQKLRKTFTERKRLAGYNYDDDTFQGDLSNHGTFCPRNTIKSVDPYCLKSFCLQAPEEDPRQQRKPGLTRYRKQSAYPCLSLRNTKLKNKHSPSTFRRLRLSSFDTALRLRQNLARQERKQPEVQAMRKESPTIPRQYWASLGHNWPVNARGASGDKRASSTGSVSPCRSPAAFCLPAVSGATRMRRTKSFGRQELKFSSTPTNPTRQRETIAARSQDRGLSHQDVRFKRRASEPNENRNDLKQKTERIDTPKTVIQQKRWSSFCPKEIYLQNTTQIEDERFQQRKDNRSSPVSPVSKPSRRPDNCERSPGPKPKQKIDTSPRGRSNSSVYSTRFHRTTRKPISSSSHATGLHLYPDATPEVNKNSPTPPTEYKINHTLSSPEKAKTKRILLRKISKDSNTAKKERSLGNVETKELKTHPKLADTMTPLLPDESLPAGTDRGSPHQAAIGHSTSPKGRKTERDGILSNVILRQKITEQSKTSRNTEIVTRDQFPSQERGGTRQSLTTHVHERLVLTSPMKSKANGAAVFDRRNTVPNSHGKKSPRKKQTKGNKRVTHKAPALFTERRALRKRKEKLINPGKSGLRNRKNGKPIIPSSGGLASQSDASEALCGWQIDKPISFFLQHDSPDQLAFRVPGAATRCTFASAISKCSSEHQLGLGGSHWPLVGENPVPDRKLSPEKGPSPKPEGPNFSQRIGRPKPKPSGNLAQSPPSPSVLGRYKKLDKLNANPLNEERCERLEKERDGCGDGVKKDRDGIQDGKDTRGEGAKVGNKSNAFIKRKCILNDDEDSADILRSTVDYKTLDSGVLQGRPTQRQRKDWSSKTLREMKLSQIVCRLIESSNQIASRLVDLRSRVDTLRKETFSLTSAPGTPGLPRAVHRSSPYKDGGDWRPTVRDYLRLLAFMGLQLLAQYVFVMK